MLNIPFPAAAPAPKPGSVALALGGGGARGLAHIAVLEAFDELGVQPAIIAGTSMGAIIGAAYAAGLSGKEIHAHTQAIVRKRAETMTRLLRARVGRFTDMLSRGLSNPMLIDGEIFLDLFWPEVVPDRFDGLVLPFLAIATDYASRREVTLSAGKLTPAVAGSMAIPGLIKPVEHDGMILIDGGITNPLPHDRLIGTAEFVVACDVTGGARDTLQRSPPPIAALIGAVQIMQTTIVDTKLRVQPPDLLVRPDVSTYRVLDFFKFGHIMRAAEPAKEEVKRSLARLLDARRA
jgi:NTE family protein